MKRVIAYTIMFCISFVVACATMVSLNWLFWMAVLTLGYSSYKMESEYKILEGEIDDIFGTDEDFE